MTLKEYYKKLSTLKLAKPFLDDIDLLQKACLDCASTKTQKIITYISNKYEDGINEIGKLFTNKTVVSDTYENMYSVKTCQDVLDDILYLIDCVIIISCVKVGFKNSIKELIESIKN